jgi:hypothetical protein
MVALYPGPALAVQTRSASRRFKIAGRRCNFQEVTDGARPAIPHAGLRLRSHRGVLPFPDAPALRVVSAFELPHLA